MRKEEGEGEKMKPLDPCDVSPCRDAGVSASVMIYGTVPTERAFARHQGSYWPGKPRYSPTPKRGPLVDRAVRPRVVCLTLALVSIICLRK
jgi:hypothetical protein